MPVYCIYNTKNRAAVATQPGTYIFKRAFVYLVEKITLLPAHKQ